MARVNPPQELTALFIPKREKTEKSGKIEKTNKQTKTTKKTPNKLVYKQTYHCRGNCTALVTDGFEMGIYGLCSRSNHCYFFLWESSVVCGQDYFLVF